MVGARGSGHARLSCQQQQPRSPVSRKLRLELKLISAGFIANHTLPSLFYFSCSFFLGLAACLPTHACTQQRSSLQPTVSRAWGSHQPVQILSFGVFVVLRFKKTAPTAPAAAKKASLDPMSGCKKYALCGEDGHQQYGDNRRPLTRAEAALLPTAVKGPIHVL